MKIVLLFPGKPRPAELVAAVTEYVERLGRLGPFELEQIREEKIDRRPQEEIKKAEADRFLRIVKPDDWLVVCDERGRSVRTDDLVTLLRSALGGAGEMSGKRRLVIAIGGALGVHPELLARANATWSLSGLTLAGSVARVVLLEGLYRAMTLIKGHPYHNA
ncbi:MAG: 23S rRNA (pseudouridine(1915)-N(3))-methyltransferase RlmH [Planctomycetota bacterium]